MVSLNVSVNLKHIFTDTNACIYKSLLHLYIQIHIHRIRILKYVVIGTYLIRKVGVGGWIISLAKCFEDKMNARMKVFFNVSKCRSSSVFCVPCGGVS